MRKLLLRLPDGGDSAGAIPPVQTPGSSAAKAPEDGDPANPILKLVNDALNLVGRTLRAAHLIQLADQNVLGPLENAYDNARNALAGNKAAKEHVADALAALKIAASAFANHSKTPPGELQAVKDAVESTARALQSARTE